MEIGYRLGALAAIVGVLSFGAPVGAADLGADGRQRVLEAVRTTWVHGIDRQLALERVGPEGVPLLLELLRDPSFPRRDNAVAFLAHLAGPESTGALIGFLSAPPADVEKPEEDRALLIAPRVLGRIAGRGDVRALAFLLEATDPADPGRGLEIFETALRADLVAASLRGLGLSGHAQARSRLIEIAAGAAAGHPSAALWERTAGRWLQQTAAGTVLGPGTEPEPPAPPPSAAAADPASRGHHAGLDYANHAGLPSHLRMSDSRLDDILAAASTLAGTADFTQDVACCITVGRAGTGRSFGSPGDGLDIIDDQGTLNAVLASGVARVKVVREINFCGTAKPNIIGCARTPGSSLVVVRVSGAEGTVWLHEYGHNTGLGHLSDIRYVMNSAINLGNPSNNNGLAPGDCQRFHSPSPDAGIVLSDIGECHDRDLDDVASTSDNCPDTSNPGQLDTDGDGIGDACETGPDGDGDGVADAVDNCPAVSNPSQTDGDGDGDGDACDPCTDGDEDGFGAFGGAACAGGTGLDDCDDTDETVRPNAYDICDGRDNDCSGAADDATCGDFALPGGDDSVAGLELAYIGRAFGLCSTDPDSEWWGAVEYTNDGCVDGADLSVLGALFGCGDTEPGCR